MFDAFYLHTDCNQEYYDDDLSPKDIDIILKQRQLLRLSRNMEAKGKPKIKVPQTTVPIVSKEPKKEAMPDSDSSYRP